MNFVITILLALFTATSAADPQCSCRPVSKAEVPGGANEIIDYGEQTVTAIQGIVRFPGDDPKAGAIVEVYKLKKSDLQYRSYQIPAVKQRKKACMTGQDGRFCFPNLSSGRYSLRVGMPGGGVNFIFMKVKIDSNPKKATVKDIDLTLRVGT